MTDCIYHHWKWKYGMASCNKQLEADGIFFTSFFFFFYVIVTEIFVLGSWTRQWHQKSQTAFLLSEANQTTRICFFTVLFHFQRVMFPTLLKTKIIGRHFLDENAINEKISFCRPIHLHHWSSLLCPPRTIISVNKTGTYHPQICSALPCALKESFCTTNIIVLFILISLKNTVSLRWLILFFCIFLFISLLLLLLLLSLLLLL